MKKILTVSFFIAFVMIAGLGVLIYARTHKEATSLYASAEYGVAFEYPKDYFIVEHDTGNGERASHAVVIVPDTQTNRDLMSGKIKDSDGPPTITVQMFQNNLDHYTVENWVRNTSLSNYKLSPDGVVDSTTLGGAEALRYRWSGLYEGMTVATARPDWIYAFSVSYNSKDDQIVKDFEKILSTADIPLQ